MQPLSYPAQAPPERARRWAEDAIGEPIVAVDPVVGGRTGTISLVRTRDGGRAVLRFVPIEPWGEVGRQHVEREALGCSLMSGTELPVPRLMASDPVGDVAGGYANLTSWVPGTVRVQALNDHAIDELARAAAVIHATAVTSDQRPRDYAFWAPDDLREPHWSARPDLWRRAIALFRGGTPDTASCLVHRDFHPGNVLWIGDTITAVIDWAETSWGPADLDVAHSCTNFAMLHDLDSARAFVRAYRRNGGSVAGEPEAQRFWAIADILGFLPDPNEPLAALAAQRPDLSVEVIRQRLEEYLGLVLDDRL